MLGAIDKKPSYTGFQQRNLVLPSGITKKESHLAQPVKVWFNGRLVKERCPRCNTPMPFPPRCVLCGMVSTEAKVKDDDEHFESMPVGKKSF